MQLRKINLDKVGACASAVCAVHCLLTGVALGLLSVMGFGFLGHPIVDLAFVALALLVGGFALRHGIRSHKSYIPAAFFVVGLLAIAAGHLSTIFERSEGHSHGLGQTVLSVVGGSCLVLFHVLNWRLQKAKTCCGEGKICTHSDSPEARQPVR
ncbi:MAG TPA: MerC domain-containing protein [Fimbriimonadaceae bacterium]|nr:MerC domain-containing protein [Fimbriimonadaceae bacterium]